MAERHTAKRRCLVASALNAEAGVLTARRLLAGLGALLAGVLFLVLLILPPRMVTS